MPVAIPLDETLTAQLQQYAATQHLEGAMAPSTGAPHKEGR
jgi:hypothetical protein